MNAPLVRGDAPSREVPRKRAAVEHFNHAALVGGRNVPVGDMAIESAAREHAVRQLQSSCIPSRDVPVEGGALEHGRGIFQCMYIPSRNIPIECTARKHAFGTPAVAHVPPRNISIEWTIFKHADAEHHVFGVPLGNIAIKRRFFEYTLEIHERAHLNMVQVATRAVGCDGFAHQDFEFLVSFGANGFHGCDWYTQHSNKKIRTVGLLRIVSLVGQADVVVLNGVPSFSSQR